MISKRVKESHNQTWTLLVLTGTMLTVLLFPSIIHAEEAGYRVKNLVAAMTDRQTLEEMFPDASGIGDGHGYNELPLYSIPGEADWYFEEGSVCYVEWTTNTLSMEPDALVSIISTELSSEAYEYADDYFLWRADEIVVELAIQEAPLTIWTGHSAFYDRQDLLVNVGSSGTPVSDSDDAALFDAYRTIFEDYDYAISNHLSADMAPDTISYVANTTSADVCGFLFMDLNKDGTAELLTGLVSPQDDGENYIFDLYSLVDGVPVHLKSSWLRGRLYLAPEGRIFVDSFKEGTYCYDLYEVAGGVTELRLYKRFTTDGESSRLTASDENGTERTLDPGEASADYQAFCEEAGFVPVKFRPFTEWYAAR